MQFSEIIGQEAVKTQMRRMVSEHRVAHAMLLHGAEGHGTLPLAIALAQYLNCTGNKDLGDSCGACPSCRKYANLAHPDLHFVFPIIKNSDGSGDSDMFLPQWREMFTRSPYFSLSQWLDKLGGKKQGGISKDDAVAIHQKLSINAYEAKFQVLIIWHPEMMNETASNRILKILEEPPADTIFLLVGESTSEVLPTILSRTQILKVPPIDDEAMNAKLQSDGLAIDVAARTTHIACGDYVKARQVVDEADEMVQNLDFFRRIMRTCYSSNVFEMMEISNQAKDISRDGLKRRLTYALDMLRQNFVLNLGEPEIVFMTKKEEEFASRFAPFVHLDNVFGLSDAITEAIAHIEQNGNERIILMDLMMKMAVLIKRPRPQ